MTEQEFIRNTRIQKLSIVNAEYCTSDMCVVAAENLFSNGIRRKDIGALIFVTQTAAYLSPSSSYLIQD